MFSYWLQKDQIHNKCLSYVWQLLSYYSHTYMQYVLYNSRAVLVQASNVARHEQFSRAAEITGHQIDEIHTIKG